MEREKMYAGNIESDETGWQLLGSVGEFDGVPWIAFRKAQPTSEEWDYIKLVADGKAPRKANYWLSWNGKRFGYGGDYSKLLQHRHLLADMVVDFMGETK